MYERIIGRDKLRSRKYKLTEKLKILYVTENIKTEEIIYKCKKLSLSITIFIFIVTIGFCKNAVIMFSKDKVITSVNRNAYSDGTRILNVDVKSNKDKNTENINIEVDEKLYTDDEKNKLLDDVFSELSTKILKENINKNNITKDLNLINNYNNVEIVWFIEDVNIIDYDGRINIDYLFKNYADKLDNSEQYKIKLDIEADLSIMDYSKIYELELYINISDILSNYEKKVANKTIEEKVNTYLEGKDKYSKQVMLPKSIDNTELTFFEPKDKITLSFIIVALLISMLIYRIKDKDIENEIKKRNQQLEMDYAGIVSKITMLRNSGMTLISAWDKIISDYDKNKKNCGMHYAYEEMHLARNKMRAGKSEGLVYEEFGKRCGINSYLKLGNLLSQNLKKGTKGLKEILDEEVREAYEERKMLAIKAGEVAGTKLLLPMGMMLILSIVIIIVPAFLSINIV